MLKLKLMKYRRDEDEWYTDGTYDYTIRGINRLICAVLFYGACGYKEGELKAEVVDV